MNFLENVLDHYLKLVYYYLNWTYTLAKSVLIPLKLTAAASAAGAGIPKKNIGSGVIQVILNEEVEDTLKLLNSLKIQVFCWNVLVKHLKMKQKNKVVDFLICY